MKIRVLRNLGKDLPDYAEGQVVEVGESIGSALVKLRLAENLTPIHAVPPAPTIAEGAGETPIEGSVEKATEDLKAYREKAAKGSK